MRKVLKFIIISILKIKYNYINKSYISKNTNINLNTKLEGYNRIGINNDIASSIIGYGTYMGENNNLTKCKIGRYCSIASNINTIVGKHPTKDFVSTHPAFFSTRKQAGFTYVSEQLFDENNCIDDEFNIVIENDVWIGSGTNIMGGVKINNGVIIGANSLVIKDCEPYCIYAGVPARKIGQRFNNEQIEFLQDIKWWDKGDNWIINNIIKFKNIEDFIKECICE